jgi:hypothetical protein
VERPSSIYEPGQVADGIQDVAVAVADSDPTNVGMSKINRNEFCTESRADNGNPDAREF